MERKFDACVFDLDGTLVNSLEDLADSCNTALSLFDLPTHSLDEYRFFVGSGIQNLIKRSMGEASADERLTRSVYNTFNIIYEEKCLDKTRPYNGVEKMLSSLRESGVKVGVLSNKADGFAVRIVESLFGEGAFDAVWGKRREYPIKPAPQSLHAMLDSMSVEPQRCLYIGDSDVDVITAKNGGTAFCGVEWGFRGEDELRSAGAGVVAAEPSEIVKLVLQ